MKRIAVATPLALLLLAFGCGDDEPSPAADSSVTTADGSVIKNDSGTTSPLDGSLPTQPDAQVPADAQTPADAEVDANVDTLDAALPPDAEIIVVEGDAGTSWILTQQCPPSADPNPCYACEDNHCCESYTRYRANTEAIAFRQCYEQCLASPTPGTSCQEKCDAEHPSGTADFAVRATCLEFFCPFECFDAPVTDCSTCRQQQCASQLVAASATESGFLIQGCNNACGGDSSCEQACVNEYTQGAGLVVLAGDCIKTKCPQCAPQP
jgi:hypothetical protein